MDFKKIIGEYLLPLDRHIQRWLPGFALASGQSDITPLFFSFIRLPYNFQIRLAFRRER
jgi:hypothetical protein